MVKRLRASFLKRLMIFKSSFSSIESDIGLFDSKIQEIFQLCVKDIQNGHLQTKDDLIDQYLNKHNREIKPVTDGEIYNFNSIHHCIRRIFKVCHIQFEEFLKKYGPFKQNGACNYDAHKV
jgi:hypothetical protein